MKLDRKFRPFSKWQIFRPLQKLARPKDQATLVADAQEEMAQQEERMIERQQAQKPNKDK